MKKKNLNRPSVSVLLRDLRVLCRARKKKRTPRKIQTQKGKASLWELRTSHLRKVQIMEARPLLHKYVLHWNMERE